MSALRVTSIQSPNADLICQRIAQHLGAQLDTPVEFVNDIPWPEREERLDAGDIHLGWICGWPYVKKADQKPSPIELVVAPVMLHPRYRQRPIYFSDVIVHRASKYTRFADLRGAVWAYNEPHSHSGYNLTRYHLASLGEIKGYFGRVVEAGSHLNALKMVLDRHIDASAIDSTVLELALEARPELEAELRLIDTLGPSPIPPWVVARNLAPELREAIRQVLCQMHEYPEGQEILRQGQLMKMVRVEDWDYDPIREMARLAREVRW